MGKMVDKDELAFARMMAKKGNIDNAMKAGGAGVSTGESVGTSIASRGLRESADPTLTSRSLNLLKKSASEIPPPLPKVAALENMLAKASKHGLGKILGKTALGAISGGLSLGAEAFDATPTGPRVGSEDHEMETMDPNVRELRRVASERSKGTMGRQDFEKDLAEKIRFDNMVENTVPDKLSFEEQDKLATEKFNKQKFQRILDSIKK